MKKKTSVILSTSILFLVIITAIIIFIPKNNNLDSEEDNNQNSNSKKLNESEILEIVSEYEEEGYEMVISEILEENKYLVEKENISTGEIKMILKIDDDGQIMVEFFNPRL